MKRYLYCFACLVGNLVALGILLILVCQFGAVDTGLVLGGVFCVLGIIAAFLSHLLAKDHTAAWAAVHPAFGRQQGKLCRRTAHALRYGIVGGRGSAVGDPDRHFRR